MSKKISAWHFCRLSDSGEALDRNGTVIEPGAREVYRGRLVLSEAGLHASEDILDALSYAQGPVIRRVECSGRVVSGEDKLVCTVRREEWRLDGTRVLRLFASACARRALEAERAAGCEPDARSWAAVDVAERYERGEATCEDLAAAARAAEEAAKAAVDVAERYALGDATRDELAAAWAAAARAAWAAAKAAAWAAERDWQRDTLLRMIEEARR